MILDEIRNLKKKMDILEERILSYSQVGAVKYDKLPVQCSSVGSTESDILDLIESKEQFTQMYLEYIRLIKSVNMVQFTKRQIEFIQHFYIDGKSMTETANLMNVGFNAVCKLKNRINSALGVDMYI